MINFGLGLLSLGVGGNMPTEYKLIQGVDSISTGYESFKDSLNNSDNLKLNLDNLVNTPLAQYAQTEMGKYEYCQKQPNAKACMDSINHSNVDPKIQHMSNIVSSYVDRAKNTTISAVTNHDFNTESEIGGTAIVGLGFRQSTGVAIDSNGNKCTTFTTCGLAGPMVGGFSHVGGSVSTGSLSEGRVWQLGAVYDISIGIGGGFGGTINSDGSFTGGFEGSMGGIGGAIMVCSKEVKNCKR